MIACQGIKLVEIVEVLTGRVEYNYNATNDMFRVYSITSKKGSVPLEKGLTTL